VTPDNTVPDAREAIESIVANQPSLVVRTYSRIRFVILRQQFLEEIGQYFPRRGKVLDLGCGFGLFSLFYAKTKRDLTLVGVDLDSKRIAMATECGQRLGLTNVSYVADNALSWVGKEQFDAIYMLDLVHHLPREEVPVFLRKVHDLLRPGARLILKDVSNQPVFKRLFTLSLDRIMVGLFEPIHYWSPRELIAVLESVGFEVKRHTMNDILPYPHIVYVCQRS